MLTFLWAKIFRPACTIGTNYTNDPLIHYFQVNTGTADRLDVAYIQGKLNGMYYHAA